MLKLDVFPHISIHLVLGKVAEGTLECTVLLFLVDIFHFIYVITVSFRTLSVHSSNILSEFMCVHVSG